MLSMPIMETWSGTDSSSLAAAERSASATVLLSATGTMADFLEWLGGGEEPGPTESADEVKG